MSSARSGMVAPAVALTESGVLVNGLCVTDLLSGFEVRCDDADAPVGPVFRGSGVPLRRLEAVRELVGEVLEVRAEDPELTSANPVVPRTVFPWGIGASVTDVLVTGPDKEVTAAYLRMAGLRARTVDAGVALRLAGDLAAARAELAEPGCAEVEHAEPEGDGLDDGGGATRRPPFQVGRTALVTVAAVGAAVVAVGAVVVVGGGRADTADAADTPDTTTDTAATAPVEADPSPDIGPSSWREMHSGEAAPAAPAAPAVAVTVDVPGWEMTESTAEREIWTSDDAGMRVLVAAAPTPLGTQDELDAAMLGVLESLDGNGDVTVTNRAPVSYDEYFPESTTSWSVRLVDGHQVSVGCQYRETTDERTDACGRFVSTVRVR